MSRSRLSTLACAGIIAAAASSADAAYFASSVVNYTAGNLSQYNQSYDDPSTSLGAPAPLSGEGTPYQETLNPFSPAYENSQIVLIGEGGSLTLKMAEPVKTNDGRALGVISNVGLQDADYPNGTNTNPATIFGGGTAKVEVSDDGTNWTTVSNAYTFNLPANYFTDTGANASEPGTQMADFGKPFNGQLSDFNGENYSQTLSTLNGSGGGSWLDLGGTGLSEVQYIRLSVADVGDTSQYLAVDSVAENTAAVDLSATPEPTSLLLLGSSSLLLLTRRRRHA